jgi:hypothetical protein
LLGTVITPPAKDGGLGLQKIEVIFAELKSHTRKDYTTTPRQEAGNLVYNPSAMPAHDLN